MAAVQRFDHVGITVRDLPAATAFFRLLGFEPEGTSEIEGAFLDTVIGMPGTRTAVTMLRVPGSDTKLELSAFLRPADASEPEQQPATTAGLRNICFEVDDLHAVVEQLAGAGYGLVGGIGEWERTYLMCYVRGPEEVVVSLAERIG